MIVHNVQGVIVIGSGGHSRSVAEAAASSGFSVLALYGLEEGDSGRGYEALIESLSNIDFASTELCLGVGTNFLRNSVHDRIRDMYPRVKFSTIVHSSAWVSPSAQVASGAVILAHSSVGANAIMGVGSLLNTGSSLDHDSELCAFASLGPGARTGGNSRIGKRSMIGLQSGILHGRTVGEDTVVGGQSLVTKDIPGLRVAMGTPCEVTRHRKQDEKYY